MRDKSIEILLCSPSCSKAYFREHSKSMTRLFYILNTYNRNKTLLKGKGRQNTNKKRMNNIFGDRKKLICLGKAHLKQSRCHLPHKAWMGCSSSLSGFPHNRQLTPIQEKKCKFANSAKWRVNESINCKLKRTRALLCLHVVHGRTIPHCSTFSLCAR